MAVGNNQNVTFREFKAGFSRRTGKHLVIMGLDQELYDAIVREAGTREGAEIERWIVDQLRARVAATQSEGSEG